MTRKDYEKIAWVLHRSKPIEGDHPSLDYDSMWAQWADDVVNMADMLAEDNPRFDREKFLKACGLDGLWG